MGIQPNHEVLPVNLHGSIGERFVTLVVIKFLHLMKLNCRCVQLQVRQIVNSTKRKRFSRNVANMLDHRLG